MATSPSDPTDASIPGEASRPSPEELAAIVAAVAVAWPPPAPLPPSVARPNRPTGWRFSGRWWAPDDVVRPRP